MVLFHRLHLGVATPLANLQWHREGFHMTAMIGVGWIYLSKGDPPCRHPLHNTANEVGAFRQRVRVVHHDKGRAL